MSANKETVEAYIAGFRAGDHAAILACLTDDVIWEIPGHLSVTGKDSFADHIEGEGFVGRPDISISRLIEEDEVIVAEGTVAHERTEGPSLNARFCDVFEMKGGRIKRLTSYLMQLPPAGATE